jgi:TonB family protein
MLERRTRLGKYEVMDELGIGAMATVYKARNTEDGSPVAIKVPDRRLLNNVRALRQFKREGQALVRLRHPNIVRVHSVGEQNDLPYIVMDYVDGHALSQQMQHKGRFSPDEAAEILLPIADALDYSHTEDTFHCDVKPGNIRLYRGRTPVLVDFGIAQTTDGTVWDEGKPIGSVWYMSPEQARGERASERSDQYSLAIVAYEMLAGNVPFDGDNPYAIVLQQRDAKPKIPSDWGERLKEVMQRVLDKDPQRRFSSCLEFVRALQKASREHISPVVQPVANLTSDDLWTIEPDTTPRTQTAWQEQERSANTGSVWQNEKQARADANTNSNTASLWQNGGREQERPSRKLEGPQKKALFAGVAVFCLFVVGLIATVVLVRHHRAQAKLPTPAPITTAQASPPIPRLNSGSEEVSKAGPGKQTNPSPQAGKPALAQRDQNQSSNQPTKIPLPMPSKIVDATPPRQTLPVQSPVADKTMASTPSPTPSFPAAKEASTSVPTVAPTPTPTFTPTLASAVVPASSRPTPTLTVVDPPPVKRDEFVPAQLVRKTTPKYPQNASNRSFSIGVVTLKVTIGRDGKVSNPKFVSGSLFFSDAAMACVKQWEYAPAMRNGQPVQTEQTITLTFAHE